ncbi:MAG: YihY family inner membrane protein [Sedimentisphaerales bacterium]|nr:YihY family inner membrane protein [Sedimentisphaerales bacterium]
MVSKFMKFVKHDIWQIRLRDIPRGKSILIRQLRIILLAIKGFDEDKCRLRASALTYYTLLSIVPILAMMFGIAKGLGFESRIEAELMKRFEGQEEVLAWAMEFSRNLLANAQGGVIAGVGIALLFWAIVKVLGNIESSFNDIWGVQRGRSWGRKFSDYLSFMLICPVLLILSSSLTVYISSQVASATEEYRLLNAIGPFLSFLLSLLPYAVLWLAFTLGYMFMPNTRVRFRSALVAGIVAGTFFQVGQWSYIHFQIGVSRYGAIYGSFMALPLFLIWLQFSWLIVLIGAEISFAHQNADTIEYEPGSTSVNHSFRMLLSLAVTKQLVDRFCTGQSPCQASEISNQLDIPVRLVRQIMFDLSQAGVLSETRMTDEKTIAYQPARDVSALTVKFVIDALESQGETVPVAETECLQRLRDRVNELQEHMRGAPQNMALRDI